MYHFQVPCIVIQIYVYVVFSRLVQVVCYIHLYAVCAVAFVLGIIPAQVVLAVCSAPDRKLHLADAAHAVRCARQPCGKFLGVYNIATVYLQILLACLGRIVVHNHAGTGIYRNELRFVIVKCQDLLIALVIPSPLLRAALAQPYTMAKSPGHQIPARHLAAGFYLFHAAHSQRTVKKVMAVCVFAVAFVQQGQRTLYAVLGNHIAAVVQITHVDHGRGRRIAAAAGARPLLGTVCDALHADQLYVVLAGYIAAAQCIIHCLLQSI